MGRQDLPPYPMSRRSYAWRCVSGFFTWERPRSTWAEIIHIALLIGIGIILLTR